MTEMMSGVKKRDDAVAADDGDDLDEQLISQLVDRSRARGLQLTGEGSVLQQLTKRFLESALEGEITDHLGYGKHDPAGRNTGNSRNGSRAKTVLTDVGPVEISVPRDRDASFEPKIVAKRQRRLAGVDELVISLSAKGLTTGEISAHLAEVYGAEVSRQTISTITDKVIEGMAEWQNRPLDLVYPVIFIDAIHVKIRDGQVANRPIYVALAVTFEGRPRHPRAVGRRRRRGRQVLAAGADRAEEPRRRRRADDGLRRASGLPDAITTVWPRTVTQTCVVHLLRNSFRYAGRQRLGHRSPKHCGRSIPPPPRPPRKERFLEFTEAWGGKYPAVVRLWERAWAEFVPFLAFDVEIRRVICTTNAIESVNARIRRAVRARGHFPTEQAALKCVYMAVMSLDPTGTGRKRWIMRWKPALNAFEIAFDGRLAAGRK